MDILHVTTTQQAGPEASNWGNITAVKDVIATAVDLGRPGVVAVSEPIKFHNHVSLDYWIESLFGLDHAYGMAYLKAHLRHYREVRIQFIDSSGVIEESFGSHPPLTTEEILLLFRVVENKLSPEALTADGERLRTAVRQLEKKWQAERALLVRLLKREPTFEELYPAMPSEGT